MALSQSGSHVESGTAAHIHALQSKHANIEAQLRDELARPSPDAATIQHLKKRKLALKEEIGRH